MKTAIFVPPFDELADPRVLAALAADAETSGWDGLFVWDHITYRPPVQAVADPWITLSAIACRTQRLILGPLVTPLARRRPAVVARQTASLDLMSGGRTVVGVGLGGDNSRELTAFGEQTDDRQRAGMLDEALDVLVAAWGGEPVRHHGEHYLVDDVRFLPRPVRLPRPPVWVAARYGNPAPLRRAAQWDGLFPIDLTTPDQLAEVVDSVAALRGGLAGYEVAVGCPPGTDPAPWAAAGATWLLAEIGITETTVDFVRGVITDGPSR